METGGVSRLRQILSPNKFASRAASLRAADMAARGSQPDHLGEFRSPPSPIHRLAAGCRHERQTAAVVVWGMKLRGIMEVRWWLVASATRADWLHPAQFPACRRAVKTAMES